MENSEIVPANSPWFDGGEGRLGVVGFNVVTWLLMIPVLTYSDILCSSDLSG